MTKTFDFKKVISNPYCYFLVLSIIYFLFIFAHLKSNEFILAHDHFLWINTFHSDNELTARIKDNFGFNTGVSLAISYPYNLVYRGLFYLGLSLHQIEFFTFIVLFYACLVFSYFGFGKISEHFDLKASKFLLTIITLFYVIGPYGTMFINTGNFWAISFVLSYSFLPYLLFLNFKLLHTAKPTFKMLLLYSLILMVTFTYAPFAIPIAFLCSGFWIYRLTKFGGTQFVRDAFIAGITLLVLYIDSIFAYGIDVFTNYVPSNTFGLEDATYTLLQRGYGAVFSSMYSWALYTVWEPKIILTYAHYYQSVLFLTASYGLLAFVFFTLIKKSKQVLTSDLVHVYIGLALAAFFFKGSQPPFGSIYKWLIENIPVFISIRSPDSKFSAIITLCLAVLLLCLTKYYKSRKYVFMCFLGLIVLALPVLKGTAVLGGSHQYYKYSFSAADMQVIDYLRTQDANLSVVSYPSYNLIETVRQDKRVVIGKDLIALSVAQPFLYLNNRYAIPSQINRDILNFYKKEDPSIVNNYPVGHFLIRKKTYGRDNQRNAEKLLRAIQGVKNTQLIIDNDTYTLYQILQPSDSYATKINNATYYYNNFQNTNLTQVTLPQNYSKYWVALTTDTKIPTLLSLSLKNVEFPTTATITAHGYNNIYMLYYPDYIYKILFFFSRMLDIFVVVYLYIKRKEIFN